MITSMENPQVKRLARLFAKERERRKSGTFLVEGIRMFREVPRESLEGVYVSQHFLKEEGHKELLRGTRYEEVSDPVFSKISGTMTPQGILCEVKQKKWPWDDMFPPGRPALVLVLEAIQDPGNLGTIVRAGEGAGITGIVACPGTVSLYNPKTVRSTMGSIYRVPFLEAESLPSAVRELQERGVALYAADLEADLCYDGPDYTRPCGFLIGNEGNGLTKEAVALADGRIRIPMEGKVESLNAAIACALCMYEASRQRRKSKATP